MRRAVVRRLVRGTERKLPVFRRRDHGDIGHLLIVELGHSIRQSSVTWAARSWRPDSDRCAQGLYVISDMVYNEVTKDHTFLDTFRTRP